MASILIIEDEIAIAELEKDYLELAGFQVEMVHDGKKGLEEALNGSDLELIKTKKDALLTAAQGVATKAYQKAQNQQNPETGSQNDDGTINADFEDVSDDNRK